MVRATWETEGESIMRGTRLACSAIRKRRACTWRNNVSFRVFHVLPLPVYPDTRDIERAHNPAAGTISSFTLREQIASMYPPLSEVPSFY